MSASGAHGVIGDTSVLSGMRGCCSSGAMSPRQEGPGHGRDSAIPIRAEPVPHILTLDFDSHLHSSSNSWPGRSSTAVHAERPGRSRKDGRCEQWAVLGIRRDHGGIEMQLSTAPGVCRRRVALGVRFASSASPRAWLERVGEPRGDVTKLTAIFIIVNRGSVAILAKGSPP